MAPLAGLLLTPEPRSAGYQVASCADRFLPGDTPASYPVLRRLSGAAQDRPNELRAFVCPLTSTDQLPEFLAFFFSPEKADISKPGPCASRGLGAVPILAGTGSVQRTDVAVELPSSRLAFVEFSCVPKAQGCSSDQGQGPRGRVRFVNSPSFHILTAFQAQRSEPYASSGARPTLLVLAHELVGGQPRSSLQVEVWEVPSWIWQRQGGRSIQPDITRIATGTTNAEGIASFPIGDATTARRKGLVVTATDPATGEILVGDLLRISPTFAGRGSPLMSGLRATLNTDRGVYAPGDSLGLVGLVAVVGTLCPGGHPGGSCAPSDIPGAMTLGARVALQIRWKYGNGDREPEICDLHILHVSALGMFSANISVPVNASFGRVPSFNMFWIGDKELEAEPQLLVNPSLSMETTKPVVNTCQGWLQMQKRLRSPRIHSFFDVLVADPRPPTAVLELKDWPTFFVPGKPLQLKMELHTYTGLPIQAHEVKLVLTLSGGNDQGPTEIVGNTDEQGQVVEELSFGQGGRVSWTPGLNQEVLIKVSSRGPTGEVLAETRSIPVRLSPYDISFRTSADLLDSLGPLPGQAFAVWTELKEQLSADNWLVSDSQEAVQLSLVPVLEKSDADSSGSRAFKRFSGGDGDTCMEWFATAEDGSVDWSASASRGRLGPPASHRPCQRSLSLGAEARCSFRLPEEGRYALIAQVALRHGSEERFQVGCTVLGRSAKLWRQSPLGTPAPFERFEVRPMSSLYEIGDTVSLEVWNPLAVPARLVAIWGDKSRVMSVADVSVDRSTVTLGQVRDDDCPMTECQVHIFLCSSMNASSTIPEMIPRSILFPHASPLWAQQQVLLKLSRPRRRMEVSISPAVGTVAPGSEVDVQVSLPEMGEGAKAEVAFIVVDKAWLDLRPQGLVDPTKLLEAASQIAQGPDLQFASSLEGLASAASLRKATDVLLHRLAEDPWIGFMSWPLSLRRGDSTDLDDSDFLDRYSEELTAFPQSGMLRPMMYASNANEAMLEAAPMPMMMADRSVDMMADAAPPPTMEAMAPMMKSANLRARSGVAAGGAPEESAVAAAPVALRKHFAKLVALHTHALDAGVKSWTARIRLPEDLGSYVLRAVAVAKQADGSWRWGAGEGSLRTERSVYAKPLMPRVLRYADVCRMGVVIEAEASEKGRKVTVTSKDLKNLRLLGAAEQTVLIAGTSTEVRFTVAADGLGDASVVFEIKDERGQLLDAVLATVGVKAQQEAMHVASTTSLLAKSDQGVQRLEKIATVQVVPGSGHLSISASVGFRGPLLNAVLDVMPQPSKEKLHERSGEDILAVLVGGLVLKAGYNLQASSPLDAAVAAATAQLPRHVTNPYLGFRNSAEHRGEQSQQAPDLASNSLALFALRAAGSLGQGTPKEWAPLDREMLRLAAYEALKLQQQSWERCCKETSSLGSFIGYSTLALFFLGEPEAQSKPGLLDLWLELDTKAVQQELGTDTALLTVLASAIDLGPSAVWNFGADRRAQGMANRLLQRTRVQGATAYIAQEGGSMHAASGCTGALSLWLWTSIDGYAKHPFAPLLASQLLEAVQSPWQHSVPARTLFMSALALLAFDTVTGSASFADLDVKAVALPASGAVTLFQAALGGYASAPLFASFRLSWSELPASESIMGLSLQLGPGSGAAVISIAMDFVPAVPFLEPQFRGIFVQKAVQRIDFAHPGNCRGPPLRTALPGEILCVTILVTTPDDLSDVTVLDLVPGGLEPLDDALPAAAAAAAPVGFGGGGMMAMASPGFRGGKGRRLQGAFAPPWWWFSQSREVRRDSVRWRARYLWAGTHTFSYACVVNVPGAYALPAAKAFSTDHPEVMGLSAAGSFLVREVDDSASAVSAPSLLELRAAFLQVPMSGGSGSNAATALVQPKACDEACPESGSCNLAKGRCECVAPSGEMLPCAELSRLLGAPRAPTKEELQVPFLASSKRIPWEDLGSDAETGLHSTSSAGEDSDQSWSRIGTLTVLVLTVVVLYFFCCASLEKMAPGRRLRQGWGDGGQADRGVGDSFVQLRETPSSSSSSAAYAERLNKASRRPSPGSLTSPWENLLLEGAE
ncbi:unnamed protein product [Polarella glacialis]|uniref:Bacterial alpha-2-macroglobulin MG10 domain-containing protein n=1 Tax=Polarella glacialis TaxID=89957 RepID=A0A813L9T1_POLGL|nr:unnamed protein product [Polarella glacialis]